MKTFINKLELFTNFKVKYDVIWNVRKSYLITKMFPNKAVYIVCIGVCLCGTQYVGKTARNTKIRRRKHNKGVNKNSECE